MLCPYEVISGGLPAWKRSEPQTVASCTFAIGVQSGANIEMPQPVPGSTMRP